MELLIDDKIIFEDWNPREKTIQRLATIGAVLAEYEAEGYRLTLRQLYYQLVARGVIANQQAEYDKLGTMLVKARKAGWCHGTLSKTGPGIYRAGTRRPAPRRLCSGPLTTTAKTIGSHSRTWSSVGWKKKHWRMSLNVRVQAPGRLVVLPWLHVR